MLTWIPGIHRLVVVKVKVKVKVKIKVRVRVRIRQHFCLKIVTLYNMTLVLNLYNQ
jgi:hypothetical protein